MNYLTSLRGIAAFMVVLFHVKHLLIEIDFLRALYPVYSRGYLAVDFFFVLSGFIIAFNYQRRFENGFSGGFYDFIAKRIARIYPLHVFVLAIYIAIPSMLILTGRDYSEEQFSIYRFFLKLFLLDLWTFSEANWQSWNIPSWTISGEWCAYLLFPLMAFIVSRLSFAHRVLLAVMLAVGLSLLYESRECSSIGSCIGSLGLLRCVFGFMIGVCVYNLHLRCVGLGANFHYLILTLALAALVGNAWLGFANYWVIPSMFALALLGIVGCKGFLHQTLEAKPLVYLGDISYSVYLTHMFVAECMFKAFVKSGETASSLFLVSYIVVTLVFSAMSYHFVEVPARKRVYDILKGNTKSLSSVKT